MFDGILYFLKMTWKYNRKYIILLVLNQITKIMLAIATLFLPQLILDSLFTQQNYNEAIKYIICLLLSSFLLGTASSFISKKSNDERMRTFHCFQIDLGRCMMSTELEHIESKNFLNLKVKAEQYLYGGGQGFASVLERSFDIFGTILILLVYSTMISQLNIGVLVLLIVLIIINTVFNYHFQKKNISINLEKATQERKSAYYSDVFQNFSYGKEIRVNNLTDWLIAKYDAQLAKMHGFYASLNKNNFMYSFISLILSMFQQAVSYFYLISEVLGGRLSVGAFSLYLNAIVSFNNSIKSLISQFITLRQYTDYFQSYKEYMAMGNGSTLQIESPKNLQLHITLMDDFVIEFKNVSFSYEPEEPLIENLNLSVKPTNMIAIVGPTGSGKTTLVNLIMRFYPINSGNIIIDGDSIYNITRDSLRQSIGMVLQESWLFKGTVAQNIAYGKPDATREEIINAAKESMAHSFIKRLPKGYDTLISEDGGNLSQGQKQLLTITRVMLINPSILILDEATSNIDTRTEIKIQKAFTKMMEGRTCFVIAHRLSTIREADVILVLKDGNIIEQGNHEDLLRKKGFYYTMYHSQFAK